MINYTCPVCGAKDQAEQIRVNCKSCHALLEVGHGYSMTLYPGKMLESYDQVMERLQKEFERQNSRAQTTLIVVLLVILVAFSFYLAVQNGN